MLYYNLNPFPANELTELDLIHRQIFLFHVMHKTFKTWHYYTKNMMPASHIGYSTFSIKTSWYYCTTCTNKLGSKRV